MMTVIVVIKVFQLYFLTVSTAEFTVAVELQRIDRSGLKSFL